LIDYKKHSLLAIVKKDKDHYAIMLILRIAATIFSLTKELTCFPALHPELIASGLVWQAVRHGYFDLSEKTYRKNEQVKAIIADSAYTLKHLVSFADQFFKSGAESFQFKSLTKDTEKMII